LRVERRCSSKFIDTKRKERCLPLPNKVEIKQLKVRWAKKNIIILREKEEYFIQRKTCIAKKHFMCQNRK